MTPQSAFGSILLQWESAEKDIHIFIFVLFMDDGVMMMMHLKDRHCVYGG